MLKGAWFYNWNPSTACLGSSFPEFVPMIWGANQVDIRIATAKPFCFSCKPSHVTMSRGSLPLFDKFKIAFSVVVEQCMQPYARRLNTPGQ
jgi:hypothetical protein